LVEQILSSRGLSITDVLGSTEAVQTIEPQAFVTEQYGLPTVQDVLSELEKPGRDPRPEFKTAQFRDDVQSLADLQDGMILEGIVTNVTNFGAFIDIGVHQDGLVHVSELSNGFVNDPQKVVKPNQIVKVRVMSVDVERKRISLSLRLQPAERPARTERPAVRTERPRGERPARDGQAPRAPRPEGQGQRPPRGDRPQGERRADKPRSERPQAERRTDKPREDKIGSLGALLQQAGLKKSGQ
jgi:uncharacterized protein